MPLEQDLPPPPKKSMKFGKQPQAPEFGDVNEDMNALSRRLRMMEEGFANLRRFLQITEENILAKNRHYSAEIKTVASDIMEIRKEIAELRDKLGLVIRELQTVARREEVKVLEKYINLWNPIRFVTHNEVESIINEVLEKKDKK